VIIFQIDGHFCYNCKNIVVVESQPQISFKIKQKNGDDYEYILKKSWIKSLFSHDLINPKNLK